MRRWLARLAFSFFVLAAVFAWQGRKLAQHGDSATVYYALAATLAAAGVAGLRERHRSS